MVAVDKLHFFLTNKEDKVWHQPVKAGTSDISSGFYRVFLAMSPHLCVLGVSPFLCCPARAIKAGLS